MGNNFIPPEIGESFFDLDNWHNAAFIQFIHRLGAYSVFIIVLLLIGVLLKIQSLKLNKVVYYLIITLLIQMLTGIITVLYSVPIIIALIHQIFAIILLSVTLRCYFLIKTA
jgi:cytochrome c oxidase assembly protein subunit 15